MTERDEAVERLAWLLHATAAEADGNPDWVFDEWPVADWARVGDDDARRFRALAERVARTVGLVAVDPALVEAVRDAREWVKAAEADLRRDSREGRRLRRLASPSSGVRAAR